MKTKSEPFIVISGAVLLCYILSDFEQFAFMKPYMETTMLAALLVIFVVGWIVGILGLKNKGDGTLQIDTSDHGHHIYRFVYNEDLPELAKKEVVIFKVEKTKLEDDLI